MPTVIIIPKKTDMLLAGQRPQQPLPTSELNMDMNGMNWVYVNMTIAVMESTVGEQSLSIRRS